MAMISSDSSHHGVVENCPNGIAQSRRDEVGKLGASWYYSRKEIEENSPSRRDGIDLKKESCLRRSYCSFLQDLGMKLKVPQVTIATAMVFCHRFYLRQSHAKNDRRTIATVCMFLAGKVEETPRPLKDVIMVSYDIIHKKDPAAAQRIKQKEIYDKQKELILLAERAVLVTLGFDLNIHHAYKPLVEAIRKFNVSLNTLPQVAWNFVNDGLRTSLCLQFEPHQIAAGAIFLAAKFLKVKLPSDGDKIWWQAFDVTPRQLEEVSNQMLELYEQNRSKQGEQSQGSEAEGSSAVVRNQRPSVKPEGNNKESSARYHQASKQSNSQYSSTTGAPGHHDTEHSNPDEHGSKMHRNVNGDLGSSKERGNQYGSRIDAATDSLHNDKSMPEHQYSKSIYDSDHPMEEHKPHQSNDNSSERRDGVLDSNEAPSVSISMRDAMNKIDKEKVKAALAKRRKLKGDVGMKVNTIDDDELLERELEHGVELAVEDENIKPDKRQDLSHGSMHQRDLQDADKVTENGHSGKQSEPTTAAEGGEFYTDSKEQHIPLFDQQNDGSVPVDSKEHLLQFDQQNDVPVTVDSKEQHLPQFDQQNDGSVPVDNKEQHLPQFDQQNDGSVPVGSKEGHLPQFDEQNDGSGHKSEDTGNHHGGSDDTQLAGRHEQDAGEYKRPKLEV